MQVLQIAGGYQPAYVLIDNGAVFFETLTTSRKEINQTLHAYLTPSKEWSPTSAY